LFLKGSEGARERVREKSLLLERRKKFRKRELRKKVQLLR